MKKLKNISSSPNSVLLLVVDYLPDEVIQEILSRLPITSLFDSRYVCQTWRGLINDPRLSVMHYTQTCRPRRSRPITTTTSLLLYDDKSNLYYIPDFNTCKTPVMFKNLHFVKSWLPTFIVVGSCNGFVCLADETCRYRSIFVCNPVIGDCFLVPENGSLFGLVNGTNYGFGYDSGSNEYKVVRMRPISNEKYYEVEIHTLGTDSWRNIGKVKKIVRDHSRSSGVLVNGNLHWLGILNDSDEVSIISVCLTSEKLQDTLPISMESIVGKIGKSFHLGELGGCLIIVDGTSRGHVNVWMMKEYGNWGSWTKQYIWKRPPSDFVSSGIVPKCFRPLALQDNGEILIEINRRELFSYNPEKRRPYRMLHIKGLPDSFKAVPHVGTLVPLKRACELLGFENTKEEEEE